MKVRKSLTAFLAVLLISVFAFAAIDLDDPLNSGNKSSPIVLPGNQSLEGTIYTTTGEPLRNSKVYIIVGSKQYQAYSDFQGYFRLNLPLGEMPNMVVLQVEAEGYIPENRVYYVNGLSQNNYAFQLAPVSNNYFVIDSRLHHLGDDLYTGIANSQFQLPTSGTRYQTNFELPVAPGQIEKAILKITVKGAESNNPVEINGKKVGYLRLNNNYGNSGEWQVEIPKNVLRSGSNSLTISSYFDKDYDDFEFSNIRVELAVKKTANPPSIEINEPLDGTTITSYESSVRVNLRGTVSAEANISYINVNGKTLGGIWGRYAGINETLYLSQGANTITIEAADSYGQTTRKTITVNVLGYSSFSYDLIELFTLSWLDEHQSALRYLQNFERLQNTLIVIYPMWGERNYHESFVNRYKFLAVDKLAIPEVFINGNTRVNNFNSYYRTGFNNKTPQFRVSYKDTSSYNRQSGRLYLDYIPANINRDLTIQITLAEVTGSTQNYLEAREVFTYNIGRSYQNFNRNLDIPVSFSTYRRGNLKYVVSIHDTNTKELLLSDIL